ncbi:MAG: nitrate/sulfonate/bicarbonate ABC transporter ATP-binding protein [Burkholderiales bacterium]|nr:nitrate/sulfonate/bicarbonate ABC transporter ATP-binding protein [Burkholderiales bacterium]
MREPHDAARTGPLLALQGVCKSFRAADGTLRPVLDHIDLVLRDGEIVALLGPSGSGKSTVLRILAGLIGADVGSVHYRGQPVYGPVHGVAMVFQSFALFPWLTVQGNVELGLEARGVPAAERERRAHQAIALIGLAGFEGALPRELSGGMRQRVGIARALVVEPEVLLMDEAFSALDVLTGERLREDILALWRTGALPTRAMLVVSHDIEEAVLMADRILVLGSDPGRLRAELPVPLPRPRLADSLEVRELVDEVYGLMTAGAAPTTRDGMEPDRLHLIDRLPAASVTAIINLLERLARAPMPGRATLPVVAASTELTDAQLLPVTRAVSLLGLAHLVQGELQLTPLGRRYVDGSHTLRREIFGQQLLAHVPLVAHIRHALEQHPQGAMPEKAFLRLLQQHMDAREAAQTLRTVIEWGRHGEVFGYDLHARRIHLPGGETDAGPPAGRRP